ncbi:MAG TPA: DNA alkylation repair protein [Thermoanaerobaculia bacterium]|nr:DNA alkylation repair protein [Thermoanaerobaculia bacterium]
MRAADALRALRALEHPERARFARRFFRAGPGEYGEGDKFLGLRVPQVRKIAREFRLLPLGEIEKLLASPWHEARLLGLVVMIHQFERGDEAVRRSIYRSYLSHTDRINNWDLVDISAPHIVGAYLQDRNRSVLRRLARSKSLWERRMAILATFHFIRQGEARETLRIAELLRDDEHDLIRKAVRWMLREAKRVPSTR